VRSVDCQISASDLDALIGALGIARREGSGPRVFELVRSSQTASGVLGMIGPWLATIAILGVGGAVLGVTGAGEGAMASPNGRFAIGAVSVGVVVIGLVATVVRAARPRVPELALHIAPDRLVLRRRDGRELASAPWSSVRATAQRYLVRSRGGSLDLAVLELAIGDARRLVIACWQGAHAWAGDVPRRRRAPRYLVGSPHWPQLVDELARRGALVADTRR
jgi:hypothetical protein